PARDLRLPGRKRGSGRGRAPAAGPAAEGARVSLQGILVARGHRQGTGSAGGDVPPRALPVDGVGSGTLGQRQRLRGRAAGRAAVWDSVKEILEGLAQSCSPDVIIAPSRDDAHQDHRTIGEIIPTVFRDQLYLAYEIPKWDGDFRRPSVYVPMSAETARRKV